MGITKQKLIAFLIIFVFCSSIFDTTTTKPLNTPSEEYRDLIDNDKSLVVTIANLPPSMSDLNTLKEQATETFEIPSELWRAFIKVCTVFDGCDKISLKELLSLNTRLEALSAILKAQFKTLYEKLTDRQKEIVDILRQGPMSRKQIMEKMKQPPSTSTVVIELKNLKNIGLIDQKGNGRGRFVVWGLAS